MAHASQADPTVWSPILIPEGSDIIHKSPEETKHLSALIQGIKVAMLTTIGPDGSLRSRPMATQQAEFDGTLWFFTQADSPKVDEVQQEQHINLSYADCDKHRYVSISGRATLIQERQKIEELWSPTLNTWFPRGLDDPQLALLRVEADSWDYWDCQMAAMVPLDGFKPSSQTDLEHEPEKPRKGDLSDTWVTQDVGTRKTRNAMN